MAIKHIIMETKSLAEEDWIILSFLGGIGYWVLDIIFIDFSTSLSHARINKKELRQAALGCAYQENYASIQSLPRGGARSHGHHHGHQGSQTGQNGVGSHHVSC